jgi:NAD(P)-dependent dehydrogenase (short-subunit alcohol dehydrogenase family)
MINPLDLTGRTIVVTGASAGIGRSTAVLLSGLGARIVLVGRNMERLDETARLMEGDHHRVSAFDLTRLDEIPQWFAGLVGEVGPFSGLAHCAGITSLVPLRVLGIAHLDEVMRTNFYSAVVLTKEFARKRLHTANSSIVLVASVAGMLAAPARSAYSASKGALIAFAKSVAVELAKSGVRVNCVAPSYVRTEMYERTTDGLTPEQLSALVNATQPLGIGTPLDVAHAIAYLIGDTGQWITGSVLSVDGGYAAQ